MDSLVSKSNAESVGDLDAPLALLASPAYPAIQMECAHLSQWFRSQRKATDKLAGLHCALTPEEERPNRTRGPP